MGKFVVVAYKPKADKDQQLLDAIREHLEVLRSQQLATDRPAYVMQAGDGTILEVFEWQSAEAISRAHSNPAVQALWAKFGEACDYIPLASIAECQQMFAEFNSIEM
jgi:quinol monooxygenase YgiN